MDAEDITLEPLSSSAEENNDPAFTGNREEAERDLSVFISSFEEGATRHLSNSSSVRKIKRYSEEALHDIGGDPEQEKSVASKMGTFSECKTHARIEQNFYGNDQLVIDIFGKEQFNNDLYAEPALKVESQSDGEFSIYAPPSCSETYKEFVKRGWAEPATARAKRIQNIFQR